MIDLSYILELLCHGISAMDFASFLNRAALGTMFGISGFHKTFNVGNRRNSLIGALEHGKIPYPRIMCWPVAITEMVAGAAVVIGLATAFFAMALFTISFVAFMTVERHEIAKMNPINRFDWISSLFWIPAVLFCIQAITVVFGGPNPYSVDAVLLASML